MIITQTPLGHAIKKERAMNSRRVMIDIIRDLGFWLVAGLIIFYLFR